MHIGQDPGLPDLPDLPDLLDALKSKVVVALRHGSTFSSNSGLDLEKSGFKPKHHESGQIRQKTCCKGGPLQSLRSPQTAISMPQVVVGPCWLVESRGPPMSSTDGSRGNAALHPRTAVRRLAGCEDARSKGHRGFSWLGTICVF